MQITSVSAREILNSRGFPTIEARVSLEDGTYATGQVPAGASTGSSEAHVLIDNDPKRYLGHGMRTAVSLVNEAIAAKIIGMDAYDQPALDATLIDLDGTVQKTKLGGNALLSVSMAVCRAAALSKGIPLYVYFSEMHTTELPLSLPEPLVLLLEGGKHGDWSTDCQEFLAIPQASSFPLFSDRIRVGAEVFHHLHALLVEKGYSTGVGFEGAFCPREITSNAEAFELMNAAIEKAGFTPGKDVVLGIDAAASEFFVDGMYVLRSENNTRLTPDEWAHRLRKWIQMYSLRLLEDIFHEESWDDWSDFTSSVENTMIVGDDLITTNVSRIQKAIDAHACTASLIKPNQIGTITETLKAISLSQSAGFTTIVSHRGSETNDDFIADLCVGTKSPFCKFGGPDRGERIAKYNRLLAIEEQLSAPR